MKLLLITLLAFSTLAQDPNKKSNQKNPEKEKLIVSDIKKSEIEKSLENNEQVNNCRKAPDQSKCIKNMLDTLDDKALEKIGKDLGGSAFKVDGGARSESIKNFMQERISKLIYGDKKEEDKTKPPKVVGHGAYREIYKSQLGKNMLLDINTYCLENIGFDDPKSILSTNDGVNFGKAQITGDKSKPILSPATSTSPDVKGLIRTLKEYTRGIKDIPGEERSSETLNIIKKASLSLFKGDGTNGKALGQFCRSQVIPKMCLYYKCNTSKNLQPNEITKCNDELGLPVSNGSARSSSTKDGRIACSLITKLESYKKTFVGLNKQKEFLDKQESGLSFSNVSESINPEYDKIDEITSVGSKELTNEVDSLKQIDDDIEQIENDCIVSGDTDSDLCSGLASSMSKDEKDKIGFENQLANAVYEQKVLAASKGSPEDFKKYLEENGLLDKYGQDIGKIDNTELANIIANDYKSKKDALNDSMMAKLEALNKTTGSGDKEVADKGKTIKAKKDQLAQDKEYIETMFEYNNIVTSYLELSKKGEKKDGSDREVIGSFGQNKKSELASLEKYKASMNDEEIVEYEEYKKMFSDDGSSGSSNTKNSMDSVDFIGFLDSVLGTPAAQTK